MSSLEGAFVYAGVISMTSFRLCIGSRGQRTSKCSRRARVSRWPHQSAYCAGCEEIVALGARHERVSWRFSGRSGARTCCIVAEEGRIASFTQRPVGQAQNGLRGIFLAGSHLVAIEFKKENANHKAGALISIDKGMVSHNACGIRCRHLHEMSAFGIGETLSRPRQGRL